MLPLVDALSNYLTAFISYDDGHAIIADLQKRRDDVLYAMENLKPIPLSCRKCSRKASKATSRDRHEACGTIGDRMLARDGGGVVVLAARPRPTASRATVQVQYSSGGAGAGEARGGRVLFVGRRIADQRRAGWRRRFDIHAPRRRRGGRCADQHPGGSTVFLLIVDNGKQKAALANLEASGWKRQSDPFIRGDDVRALAIYKQTFGKEGRVTITGFTTPVSVAASAISLAAPGPFPILATPPPQPNPAPPAIPRQARRKAPSATIRAIQARS